MRSPIHSLSSILTRSSPLLRLGSAINCLGMGSLAGLQKRDCLLDDFSYKKEEGNLATINDVVLNSGSASWAIDVDVATKLLSSLQSPKLDWPARCMLTPYLPASDSARAWLTEMDKPVSTASIQRVDLA